MLATKGMSFPIDVIAGSQPFVFVMLVMLALITAFPGAALWLPSLFY